MDMTTLIDKNILLVNIEKIFTNELCSEILINLENNLSLCLKINPNTDEILIFNQSSSHNDVNDIHKIHYKSLSNHILLRSWIMKNNLGYQDAIQFEFWDTIKLCSIFIQVQAVASNLELFEWTV